ncbi:MAG: aminodeoxychorismate/anthranilate synthase component II [Cyclobacteriaceae bacterium]|nr:aminodeoxychorismate/anthranilate synthase component II [Cyclobacteriaceae bacterium]MCH8515848.1 aminodeoxychorismate/anthranilate synthase component II [Cyclobacteriaceae bacterium]
MKEQSKIKIGLLDNFDSFTYNLVDYLLDLGADVDVFTNEKAFCSDQLAQYDGLLLSPGPKRPEDAGSLMSWIRGAVGQLPILGVCLGHQALGIHFGAKLIHAQKPMHGKISEVIKRQESLLLKDIPDNFKVVRYHSLILTYENSVLQPLLITKEGEMMAFQMPKNKIYGLQYHPEAWLTEYGKPILRNWLDICFNNIKREESTSVSLKFVP